MQRSDHPLQLLAQVKVLLDVGADGEISVQVVDLFVDA
jgi:hypothetical protein